MASFTGVGDNVTLFQADKGEDVTISITGTYEMVIALQKEVGSKGSGAWQNVPGYYYDAHDSTISALYTTQQFNENLRLIVLQDTDGTATATLTSGDKVVKKLVDDVDTPIMTHTQSETTFHKNVELQGSFQKDVVDLTAATYVLTFADHAGRILLLNRSGGIDIDLPQSTGSGAVFDFYVGTATADAYELSVFDVDADGICQGVICGVDDEAEFTWGADATDNTVTLGGTGQATGGTVGDWVRFVDVAAGVYSVQGFIHQGGTEANPFSTDS